MAPAIALLVVFQVRIDRIAARERETLGYDRENRVVWRQIGQRCTPFTDDDRRRLTIPTGIIARARRPWTSI